MTVAITIDGDEANFVFEKVAATGLVVATADSATRYIYAMRWQLFDVDEILIPYDELTNAQKMEVLDNEITYHLRGMAKTYWITNAAETARDDAKAEAEEMFL